jgi:DNA-binding transcriptional regulator GbsR (MarR family)
VRELGAQVGNFIEFWGFKRIHGEVWLHLYVSKTPLDAGDLIARLGISKSLASLCLAELVHYDVIREAGKSDAGTTLYEANEDVVGVIANVLKMREKVMLDRIAEVAGRAGKLSLAAQEKASLRPDRITYVSEITTEAAGLLEMLLDRDSKTELDLFQMLQLPIKLPESSKQDAR